ncbi:hypothetical protein [Roseicella aquatilis]|uniref:hypothetical protein n=1 Tax=Roseicella aquatilis TaxID=2527868 RepID=UPI0014050BC4|nr:hypothetical protein [Roseicella aquatilis]
MREASHQQARTEQRALAVAVAWMLLVQLACVVLWDAAYLGRQAALVHWLVVGVLPPALALWGMRRAEVEQTEDRPY